MKELWFAGDTHGQFRHIENALRHRQPDALVFVGDLEPRESLEKVLAKIIAKIPVWWIPGNHDSDSDENVARVYGSSLIERNIDGRVAEVAGYRIAGLGGVFRESVWMPPGRWRYENYDAYVTAIAHDRHRDDLARTHRSTIFPAVYQELAKQAADILVCHEAPSPHPSGHEALDLLASAMGAQVVVHGHQHDRLDYRAFTDKLGFRTIGVGLRGVTALDGEVIVPGELDEERSHRQTKISGTGDAA